jgi:hypothetical protein
MQVATAASVASLATGLLVPPLIPMLGSLVPLFMFYQTSPATHSPAYRQGKSAWVGEWVDECVCGGGGGGETAGACAYP